MQGSSEVATIVFLLLAVYVVWKLRSVLGARTGHESARRESRERLTGARDSIREPGPAGNGSLASANDDLAQGLRRGDQPAQPDNLPGVPAEMQAEFAAIRRLDSSFDVVSFLAGAKAAYEMIVMAFANGDKATLKPLLSPDVFESFARSIDERLNRKETIETTVVSIDDAVVRDVQVKGRTALISLELKSKAISATRDVSGTVIEGDPERIAEVVDLWSFSRDLSSRDPNWKLVATSTG